MTSSSHNRFRLFSLLHLPKRMIPMTLLPFRQKINGQAHRHNSYTFTPLHLIIISILLSSSVTITTTRRMEKSLWWKNTIVIAYVVLWWKSINAIVLPSFVTVHDTLQNRECIFSLLYPLLRIRLKRQNPLLSYVRQKERERESIL